MEDELMISRKEQTDPQAEAPSETVLEQVTFAADENAERQEANEAAGEEALRHLEIADTHLDIEGISRFGEAWTKAKEWSAPAWKKAKQGFEWAKAPSTTYPEAAAKAAIFSAGTTVFLAPLFLARNCHQVYRSRQNQNQPMSGQLAHN